MTRLIGSFREEPGIFPGWHMDKAHWLSIALADMGYELTNGRRKYGAMGSLARLSPAQRGL